MSAIALDLTGLGISGAAIAYLDENWPILAAAAYEGYLNKGRGIVFVDCHSQIPFDIRDDEMSALYMTAHGKLTRAAFPEGFSANARRLIREYHPKTQVVFCFWESGLHKFRTIGMLGISDPPEGCYERLKGRMDEFCLKVGIKRVA